MVGFVSVFIAATLDVVLPPPNVGELVGGGGGVRPPPRPLPANALSHETTLTASLDLGGEKKAVRPQYDDDHS